MKAVELAVEVLLPLVREIPGGYGPAAAVALELVRDQAKGLEAGDVDELRRRLANALGDELLDVMRDRGFNRGG